MGQANSIDNLKTALSCLTPDKDIKDYIGVPMIAPEAAVLLPPHYYYITLAELLGFHFDYQHFEKTLWSIPFRYKSVEFRMEHAKFGIRLCCHEGPDAIEKGHEVFALFGRLRNLIESCLEPKILPILEIGDITLNNRFGLMSGRYQFFRERAESAFKERNKPVADEEPEGFPLRGLGHAIEKEREGFFFGVAAIDSYFSRLEHFLALALAFVEYDPLTLNLRDFLALGWGEKLKRVVPFDGNEAIQDLYAKLRDTKERFRNPNAHGGFKRGDKSLLVHYDYIGAIPVSVESGTAKIGFFPIPESTFEEVCLVFDGVDGYFRDTELKLAWAYAESGLDVAFDVESRKRYRQISREDDFSGFLEGESYRQERGWNMDW